MVLATIVSVLALSTVAAGAVTSPATATLEQGSDVHPGDDRTFAVRVSGDAGLLSERIDYVSITLPAATAGVTISSTPIVPPSGWTVQKVQTSNTQALKFQTTGDARIARDDTEVFTFPADVSAPSGDRTGGISVQVSSNGGREISDAQGSPLPMVVRVLEMVDLEASAPHGVSDQSATAGQEVTYDVAVTNHASRALAVSPELTSEDSADQIGHVAAESITSGETQEFSFPIRLSNSSGTRTLTAGATAPDSNAVRENNQLLVQRRAILSLSSSTFSPTFVRSDEPIPYDFTVDANKSGDPELTVRSCRLAFAETSTDLIDAPLTLEPGAQKQNLAFDTTTVSGKEGTYDATVSCSGHDENDKPETYHLSLSEIVTIDNTAPIVDVDDLVIPSDQDAVKNGDPITVNGTITGETSSELEFVQLRTGIGQIISCPEPSRDGDEFSCTIPADEVTFDRGTESVRGEAQVTDPAGNVGAGRSTDATTVDLHVPELHFAETEQGSQLSSQIRVQFAENSVIRGGCDPGQWTVEGTQVSSVRYSDDSLCRSGEAGPSNAPDNYRILVLSSRLGPDDEPEVTYRPSSSGDNVRDGANNTAKQKTISSVTSIVPQAPQIMEVTRSDHRTGEREDAVADGDGTKPDTVTYWTNQSGDDLRVKFAGAKDGYRVQVVDGDANPLTTPRTVDGTSDEVAIPIGDTDDRVVRGIRLINNAGPGEIAYLDVVLDRAAPHIISAEASQPNPLTGEVQITVLFTDVLAAGRDFASDWWIFATSGNVKQPSSVTGSRDTRTLTVDNYTKEFAGVEYVLSSADEDNGAARYEDRAGNLLTNSSWGSL